MHLGQHHASISLVTAQLVFCDNFLKQNTDFATINSKIVYCLEKMIDSDFSYKNSNFFRTNDLVNSILGILSGCAIIGGSGDAGNNILGGSGDAGNLM